MKSLTVNSTGKPAPTRFPGPSRGLDQRAIALAAELPAVRPEATAGRASMAARRLRGSRVAPGDLLFVTMQLAIMVRAGVDLATALDSLARQSRSPALREVLLQVHADVSAGVAVAEALSRHTSVFGETYVASIAAGEASGNLAEVLSQLAQLQRSEVRLRNTMRALLGYPVLLATVCALVLAGLVLFVLPSFAEIFEDSETPLPLLTQLLLGFANECRSRFWLWLPVAGVALGGAVVAWRSHAGRQAWDRCLLRARPFRDVTRAILAGRTFRLLATMLDSGVPLVEALGLVTSSVGNRVVRAALTAVQDDVMNGRPMAASLSAADVMPATAAEMIGMAERTGSLAMVSRLVGDYYEEEGESRLRTLVGLLEPAIVLGMGAVVATVVLSVMLPMFDLVTIAQQGG
jgi:type II secretory pathway component PulF